MAVINTNISATIAQNSLVKNERMMSKAMEQLSTGQRINSAADDAAGLAISSRMTSQIKGLDQAVRNANDAVSLLQTADGALGEISNMLQRMRELAVQASNGVLGTTEIGYLQTEFGQLEDEINRIAQNTQFNGQDILNGNDDTGATANQTFSFQLGPNAGQSISVSINSFVTTNATSTALGALDTDGGTTDATLATQSLSTSATAALYAVTEAIDNVNGERATLGASLNRLQYAADNLANESANTVAARSRIQDADYASATTELARTQIIQQAGTAMLAQANQMPQSVLSLLQ